MKKYIKSEIFMFKWFFTHLKFWELDDFELRVFFNYILTKIALTISILALLISIYVYSKVYYMLNNLLLMQLQQ